MAPAAAATATRWQILITGLRCSQVTANTPVARGIERNLQVTSVTMFLAGDVTSDARATDAATEVASRSEMIESTGEL